MQIQSDRNALSMESSSPVSGLCRTDLPFSSFMFLLQEQMELEREKTSCAFRELRLFLEEKEELLLAQMQKVEKEIVRRRDENMARLSGKLTFLDSLIQEMEEKNQEPVSEFVLVSQWQKQPNCILGRLVLAIVLLLLQGR